jgi:hypothetical protein
MQHLDLQLRNLRVRLIRRRLRQMGFREIADEASAETLLLLERDNSHEFNRNSRWLRIGLTFLVVLILGLSFWLHPPQRIPIAVPPSKKPSSSQSLPATTYPELPDFEEPTPLSYAS